MKVLEVKQLKVDPKGKIIEIPIPKQPAVEPKSKEERESSPGFDSNRLHHMKHAVDKMYGQDEELDKEYPNVGSAKMYRDILLEREKKQMQLELDVRRRRQLNIMKKMARELERELEVEAQGMEKFEAEIDKAMKKLELDAKKRELELLKVEIDDQIQDDNEQLKQLDVLAAENQISQLIRDNEKVIQKAETNIHTGMLQLTGTNKSSKATSPPVDLKSKLLQSKPLSDEQTVKKNKDANPRQKLQQPKTTANQPTKKPLPQPVLRANLNPATKPEVGKKNTPARPGPVAHKQPQDRKPLISSQLSATKQSFFENTIINEESVAKEESNGGQQSSVKGESFSNNTFPSKF